MANVNKEKLRNIIAGHIDKAPASLTDDIQLAEFGIESLDAIEIVFAIEEEFDIEIPYNANESDAFNMATLNDVTQSVEALIDA